MLQAVGGYPPELVGELRYRLGEGLAGWVFLEGKVVNVPDLAADPRWKREPEYEATLPSGLANKQDALARRAWIWKSRPSKASRATPTRTIAGKVRHVYPRRRRSSATAG